MAVEFCLSMVSRTSKNKQDANEKHTQLIERTGHYLESCKETEKDQEKKEGVISPVLLND